MLQVIEPATEGILAELEQAGVEETDAAVARAKAAFPAWRRVNPGDRSSLLRGLADALEARLEDLATLEARNAGKPISDARGEIGMVVETFRYYAGAPERLLGDTIPVAGGIDMTFREPLGVVGLIVPWNFPLVIAGWKLGPALAAGNTVVLKPAELTPLTAVEFERIARRSGHPRGRGQRRRRAGPRLRAAPGRASRRRQGRLHRLDRGRPRDRGRRRRRRSSASRSSSGGKSANIVFADADLERAAAAAPSAVFGNAGQDCCARSRILVQRSAMDRFMEALRGGRRGDHGRRPARRGDADGPADLRRPARDGRLLRGRRRAGGDPRHRRPRAPATGSRRRCSHPVSNADRAAREEIFGPVACVIPFADEAEAIALANDTIYGLSGSVWTHDGAKALRVARAIETGVLSINSNNSVRVSTPFGGFKQSGVGRELGPHALEHYTEVKNVYYATGEG